MLKQSDPNPAYWDGYTPFNQIKHDLIRCYLQGWYPKLGYWATRVLYVDTHAGRGKYQTGDLGSPIVALRTLLGHTARASLLKQSEFNFLFLEADPENAGSLEREIASLGQIPKRINVEVKVADAFERLSEILADLRRDRRQMEPAFLFVDPYGFTVPGALLSDLLRAGRVELFVNVMWRELDMLIRKHGEGGARRLDEIFGCGNWRTEIISKDMDERIEQAVEVWRRRLGAVWATPVVRMVTGGTATRYVLVHFTKSDDGRDLMKNCRWSIFPDGDFRVRKNEELGLSKQADLFGAPEANLGPVREWVIAKLKEGPAHWQDLLTAVRPEDWLEKHVNETVKGLKVEGKLDHSPIAPPRKFGAAANPLLWLRA
jgi:three-Cys-motif partner protein